MIRLKAIQIWSLLCAVQCMIVLHSRKFDTYRYKNELWVAMECLAGGTLKDIKESIQFGEAQIKYMYASFILCRYFI